jgi:hypothetical protein
MMLSFVKVVEILLSAGFSPSGPGAEQLQKSYRVNFFFIIIAIKGINKNDDNSTYHNHNHNL